MNFTIGTIDIVIIIAVFILLFGRQKIIQFIKLILKPKETKKKKSTTKKID